MHNFEFQYPLAFVLLTLIICIYKCPISIKKNIFPHTNLFSKKTYWINKDKLLYSFILTLFITSLASPITYDQKTSNKRKGRDLVFILDTSGSMAESNFDKEQTQQRKLDILKDVLVEFISNRFDDNVGISIFGSYAFPAVPLTYDMKSIKFLIDFFDVGIAGDSTAIGEGIASGLRILKYGHAKNKLLILITDGYQNSGAVSVKNAVEQAKKLKVKIYTIGIGKVNNFDAKLLQEIASQTKAKMFAAQNKKILKDVYQEINILEPSKIRSKHYLNKHVLYIFPLLLATFLLFYLLLKSRQSELL